MRLVPKILFFFLTLAVVNDVGGVPSQISNPPAVQYCELVANPTLYDGKQIRLHGEYSIVGSGYSEFVSSSCPGKTLWVEFDSNYASCSSGSSVKSLATMRRKSGVRWGRPHVTVIEVHIRSAEVEFAGTFHASNPFAKPAPPKDGPFDPFQPPREVADSLFTVTCINSLRQLPKGARN
jgi:hypothetical protein